MTVKEARKILGVMANNMSDIDIQVNIEDAILLKDIFFKLYRDSLNKKIETNDFLIKVVK